MNIFLVDSYYTEWEVEDIDNNFTELHNVVEAAVENVADLLDYTFSNLIIEIVLFYESGR